MADINKQDVKLMESQRLDDTDQGGGQMTSNEVQNGKVNNLFPDISRLDRVYGRVSLRKAFLAVQTANRETYYGSHTVLTEQALDPNVSVCFFSSKDWFDMRESAQNRIESYLVRGPFWSGALWGDHYVGSRSLQLHTHVDYPPPEIGDVINLVGNEGTSSEFQQYVRVTDVSYEDRNFTSSTNNTYIKRIVYLTIGEQLKYDFEGEEIYYGSDYTTNVNTRIFTTVAADASRYYGISTLIEDASAGSLQIRVDDIQTHLVPSAQSETAIVDAGVGVSIAPMLQTQDPQVEVVRTLSFDIRPNSKLYIGEGVLPGTLKWTGGITLTDNSKGDVLNGSTVVGSIVYSTGIITFGEPGISTTGNGTATYVPASAPTQVSETGSVYVDTSNRGFVYVYDCLPLPKSGTLKVEYLSGGKWYTMKDLGTGEIKGTDDSIGSGSVNFSTGSVSLSLGAMPDVGSRIMFFWAKEAPYYDLSGETIDLVYSKTLNNQAIARNSFNLIWTESGTDYAIVDNGNGKLVRATWNDPNWEPTTDEVGTILYATGEIKFTPHSSQGLPKPSTVFTFKYNYGEPQSEDFFAPARHAPSGHLELSIVNTPIVPGTFRMEWHNDLEGYDPATQIHVHHDPTYIYVDDGAGNIVQDGGLDGDYGGVIDYTTGDVRFHPDKTTVFPLPQYTWKLISDVDADGNRLDRYTFDHIEYLPAATIFPAEGTVQCKFHSQDGSNLADYTDTMDMQFPISASNDLELVVGSVNAVIANTKCMDNNGSIVTSTDGVTGSYSVVGSINYITRVLTITDDNFASRSITVTHAVGTTPMNPGQLFTFRAPGAPIRPNSFTIRATTGEGEILSATADSLGNFSGDGVTGSVEYSSGVGYATFGKWVPDDAEAQAADWYEGAPIDGSGNVYKPYSVRAETVLINCVVTSYLPLDPELLGLDPVRLPLDGKVPIFRDGYIILIHHTLTDVLPNPIVADTAYTMQNRTGSLPLDLIEVYDTPADPEEGQEYSSDFPEYIPEIADSGDVNYTVDLTNGTVTFTPEFVANELHKYKQPLRAMHRIEDMALAADVQVTGHIAITSALTRSYPANETRVSSVLPSADLQSRAYNEFEQSSWTGEWKDSVIGTPPLASYNFVDYPISVYNTPSIKERWLILFQTTHLVTVVGENFGVLVENVDIEATGLPSWVEGASGAFNYQGKDVLIIANKQFTSDGWYWMMQLEGFGGGWAAGNCIRFNQDAANFPLWFVRTTLQAPPTEPVDNYIIQVRGDSS